MAMSADIYLHIDHLVLHDLEHVDRHALAAALRQALTEQLAAQPPLQAAELSHTATRITLPAGAGGGQLGRILAGCLTDIISNDPQDRDPMRETPAGGGGHA